MTVYSQDFTEKIVEAAFQRSLPSQSFPKSKGPCRIRTPSGSGEALFESLGRNTKPILKMHEELLRLTGGPRDRTAV